MRRYPIIILGLKPFLPYHSQTITIGKKSSINSLKLSEDNFNNEILVGFVKSGLDLNKITEYTMEHIQSYGLLCSINADRSMEPISAKIIGHQRVIIDDIQLDNEIHCYTSAFHEFEEKEINIIIQEQIIDLIINNLEPIQQLSGDYHAVIKDLLNDNHIHFNEKILRICDKLLVSTSPLVNKSMQEILDFLMENISNLINSIKFKLSLESKTKEKINSKQYKFWAQEQISVLQNELNEGVDSLKQKILDANLPKDVQEVALEEYTKLIEMASSSAEAALIRNYIKWLIRIPWNIKSEKKISLEEAREILDRSHYGLETTKEKIMDFIALEQRNVNASPATILLHGAPGTGKTSIAKSIAESLGREFVRISLAGITDANYLRGQSRTYVGAMPGAIIKKLVAAKTNNPVLQLDELDKLARSSDKDPMTVITEILDPDYRHLFEDNYVELPVSLENVLFIVTANSLDNISQAILSRCTIINVESYNDGEKLEICKQYIIPSKFKEHNILPGEIEFTDGAIKKLIRQYTREAGVRQLSERIDRMISKALRKINANKSDAEIAQINANKSDAEAAQNNSHESNAATAKINDNKSDAEVAQNNSHESNAEAAKINDNKSDAEVAQINDNEPAKGHGHIYIDPVIIDEEFIDSSFPYGRVDDLPDEDYIGLVRGLYYSTAGGGVVSIEVTSYESEKFKLELAGNMAQTMQESCKNALAYIRSKAHELGIESSFFANRTIHINTWGSTPKDGPSAGCAFTTAIVSHILKLPIPRHIAMTGEISLQGNSLLVGGIKEKANGALSIISSYTDKTPIVFIPYNIPEYMTRNMSGIDIRRVKHIREIFQELWPNTKVFQNL